MASQSTPPPAAASGKDAITVYSREVVQLLPSAKSEPQAFCERLSALVFNNRTRATGGSDGTTRRSKGPNLPRLPPTGPGPGAIARRDAAARRDSQRSPSTSLGSAVPLLRSSPHYAAAHPTQSCVCTP